MDARKTLRKFFYLETYRMDCDKFLPAADSEDHLHEYGRALLACAGADGKVSPLEKDWILGAFLARGFSPESVEALAHSKVKVEKLTFGDTWSESDKRALIYNAYKAACANVSIEAGMESYQEDAAIHYLADSLGIDRGVVEEILDIIRTENDTKLRLVEVIGSDWMK